jgi:type III secretion system FlhB-like substrate exporter
LRARKVERIAVDALTLRPQLAEALGGLALGQDVPEDLWLAVAQTLAWAYGLETKAITPNR